MQEQTKFALLVERVLNSVVQNYVDSKPDRDTVAAMRADIKVRLNEMFSRCKFTLSNDSVGWLADEYFKRIRFKKTNGEEVEQLGTQLVLLDQPSVKKLPKDDLQIMANLFAITDFGDDLSEELRRRTN